MIEINGEKYYKIGEVAGLIDRSPLTIKNWYEYCGETGSEELPPYRTDLTKKGIRYWKEADIPKLVEFRDKIVRGMMSEFNAKKWGDRGKQIVEKGSGYGLKRFEKEEEEKATM